MEQRQPNKTPIYNNINVFLQNTMEVGVVKIAEDSDFCNLKCLVDDHEGWKLEYDSTSENIKVSELSEN